MERERWISRRDQASGDRALANSADGESTSIEIERERTNQREGRKGWGKYNDRKGREEGETFEERGRVEFEMGLSCELCSYKGRLEVKIAGCKVRNRKKRSWWESLRRKVKMEAKRWVRKPDSSKRRWFEVR